MLARNPVPGIHVVVDDDNVLLLDEPIPQHEGVWSLPDGHADPSGGPRQAGLRALEEETGLRGDPEDLRFVTLPHAETPDVAFYLITYALERSTVSGELTPEAEGFEAAFRPHREIESSPGRIRESDRDRIEMSFDA